MGFSRIFEDFREIFRDSRRSWGSLIEFLRIFDWFHGIFERFSGKLAGYRWNSSAPNPPSWTCECWDPPCRRKERTAFGWETCGAPRKCRRPRCERCPGPGPASRPSAGPRWVDGRPVGYRRTLRQSWRSGGKRWGNWPVGGPSALRSQTAGWRRSWRRRAAPNHREKTVSFRKKKQNKHNDYNDADPEGNAESGIITCWRSSWRWPSGWKSTCDRCSSAPCAWSWARGSSSCTGGDVPGIASAAPVASSPTAPAAFESLTNKQTNKQI